MQEWRAPVFRLAPPPSANSASGGFLLLVCPLGALNDDVIIESSWRFTGDGSMLEGLAMKDTLTSFVLVEFTCPGILPSFIASTLKGLLV